jgi:DNA-binding MarR family transcriptional regulator
MAPSEGVPWLDDTESRMWRAWITASTVIGRAIEQDLREESDLTLDDYEVLVHLSEAPEHRLRLSALGERALQSPSRLSQRIDRMTRRGLVARERCDEDRRGFWAVLTPDGLSAIEQAAPDHVRSVRRHLLEHLRRDDIERLAEVLRGLADSVRGGEQ